MYKAKILIVITLLFFVKNGISQDRQADVIGVVSMGELEYAFIQEDVNFVYKTSLFPSGELIINEVVIIQNTGEEGQIEIIAPNLSAGLYAYSIITTQGIIPPPMDNMPYVDNGILFFQTEQQASDFFVDINNYMDETRVLDEAHVDEDKLDNLENYFTGYTSYRTAENIFYDWENQGYTDEEILDYMSSDF